MVFPPQGAGAGNLVVAPMANPSWTIYVDQVLDASDQANNVGITSVYIDEANGYIYIMDGVNGGNLNGVVTDLLGNVVLNITGAGDILGPQYPASMGGIFNVYTDVNGVNFYVMGNDSLLQTLTPGNFAIKTACVSISMTGNLIAIAGADSANTKRKRLKIYSTPSFNPPAGISPYPPFASISLASNPVDTGGTINLTSPWYVFFSLMAYADAPYLAAGVPVSWYYDGVKITRGVPPQQTQLNPSDSPQKGVCFRGQTFKTGTHTFYAVVGGTQTNTFTVIGT